MAKEVELDVYVRSCVNANQEEGFPYYNKLKNYFILFMDISKYSLLE